MVSCLKRAFACAAGVSALVFAGASSAQEAEPDTKAAFGFYGQINQGYLGYDDGAVSESYFPVDNDNSGTRIGLTYGNALNSGVKVDGRFELGITPKSSAQVNLNNPNDAGYKIDKTDIRHLELSFASETAGKFTLGQGSMATDGIAGNDLSGTGVVAGVSVKDSAAGQLLRTDGGTLNGEQIKGHFTDYDGTRRMRVRYDTPNFNGFTFSASYGQNALDDDDDNIYSDVTGRYEVEAGEYIFKAGIGYSWNDKKPDLFVGSAAIFHKSTGLNLAIASGAAKESGGYGYVKAGIERDLVAAGATAFSFDYYTGTDIASDGASSKSYGFAVVQNFDKQNLEVYGTYRQYETQEMNQSYLDSEALLAGLRFKF